MWTRRNPPYFGWHGSPRDPLRRETLQRTRIYPIIRFPVNFFLIPNDLNIGFNRKDLVHKYAGIFEAGTLHIGGLRLSHLTDFHGHGLTTSERDRANGPLELHLPLIKTRSPLACHTLEAREGKPSRLSPVDPLFVVEQHRTLRRRDPEPQAVIG